MVRPYLALNHADIDFGEPLGPQVPRARYQPQVPEAHVSSEWLLQSMLIVAMLGLSMRAAMAIAKALRLNADFVDELIRFLHGFAGLRF